TSGPRTNGQRLSNGSDVGLKNVNAREYAYLEYPRHAVDVPGKCDGRLPEMTWL
ncbi:hypothetical protein KXV55_005770, partial [Aspergillus fumigatus]